MSRCSAAGSAVLLALLHSGQAFSAEPARTVVSPLLTLGKLAAALMVVLLVFWVFARVMKQLQAGQGGVHSSLQIVATLPLGQRERVVVVQAGDTQLVLGVTASSIQNLHVLDQPISGAGAQASGDFRQKLSDAISRRGAAE